MAEGRGSSSMWVGTETGSVCQLQLTTPCHPSNAPPIIATVVRLGLHSPHRSSEVSEAAVSQETISPLLRDVLQPPHPSLASPCAPGIQQSTVGLVPSKASSVKAVGKQQLDSSSQHLLAAGRSRSAVNLRRISPFGRVHEPLDAHTHALHQLKSGVAMHSFTASSGSAAVCPSAVADQVKDSHKLSKMGASQLAHDGPVHHILTAKDRVVTSGGVGAKWTLREWSLLGKPISSHKACEKGIAATAPDDLCYHPFMLLAYFHSIAAAAFIAAASSATLLS